MEELPPLPNEAYTKEPWLSLTEKVLLLISAVTICAILLSVVVVTKWRENRFRQKLSEYRLDGHPTTPQELEETHARIPNEENSAVAYLQAFEHLVPVSELRKPLVPFFGDYSLSEEERLSNDSRRAIRKILDDNRDALVILHTTTGLKQGSYPLRLNADPLADGERDLSHLGKVRNANRLLCLEALYHVYEGNLIQGKTSIFAALNLVRSMENDQNSLSNLAIASCLEDIFSVIRHFLHLNQLNSQDLKNFDEELRRIPMREVWGRCHRGGSCPRT